jgi:hypothetical protein
LKLVFVLIAGVLIGVLGHVVWQYIFDSEVFVSGDLQQEPELAPYVSASYPPGYYVESRIYLETGSTNLLGHKISAWGRLDVAKDPSAPSFPRIKNREIQ